MKHSLTRRALLRAGVAVGSAAVVTTAVPATAVPATAAASDAEQELRGLEQRHGARLGVYGKNTRTGQVVAYRANERFAMLSTFKTIAAATVLRDEHRCAPMTKMIHYPPLDVTIPHAPITSQHVDTGMPVGELCAAAIQYSDNAAGNLLLRLIDGPAGLTAFFRSIGDPVSRLDRWEVELNSAIPGDIRDTTTPQAIGTSYERLVLGRGLAAKDRAQLVAWLKGNTTSGKRFRAGLPPDWVIADKTGTGDYAAANNVGIAWTAKTTPLVLAVLSTKSTIDAPVDDALIADTARVLARTLAPNE